MYNVRCPIGFADVVAHILSEIEVYTNETVNDVKSLLENASLSLAKHKTEGAFITKRKKSPSMMIKVETQIIHSKPAFKYLSVMVDQSLYLYISTCGECSN